MIWKEAKGFMLNFCNENKRVFKALFLFSLFFLLNQNHLPTLFFLQRNMRAKTFPSSGVLSFVLAMHFDTVKLKDDKVDLTYITILTSLTKRSSVSWRACAPSSRRSGTFPSVAAVKVFTNWKIKEHPYVIQ